MFNQKKREREGGKKKKRKYSVPRIGNPNILLPISSSINILFKRIIDNFLYLESLLPSPFLRNIFNKSGKH